MPRCSYFTALLLLITYTVGVLSLECHTGYGTSSKRRVIPNDWINDGYCDCPHDGQDEPATGACSGALIGGWPGVAENANDSPFFQCPQQKSLKLPISRVNDGICDCCDGADEEEGTCDDICNVILAAEKAAHEKAEKSYRIGSRKRAQELAAFEKLFHETMKEINEKEGVLRATQQELEGVAAEFKTIKLEYKQERRKAVQSITGDLANYREGEAGPEGLFHVLTDDEIKAFIQQICQLEGELGGSNESTCVPLRLAGVENGIIWENENLNLVSATTKTDVTEDVVADLLWQNGHGASVWDVKDADSGGSKTRRRLDDYGYDDDYVMDEDDDEADPYNHHQYNRHNTNEPHSEKRRELQQIIAGTILSSSRNSFLEQSKGLIEKIDNLLDQGSEEDSTEETTEDNSAEGKGAEEAPEATPESAPRDPTALNMVRSKLTMLEAKINRGFDYAVSAHVLLGALDASSANSRSNLLSLAAWTLLESNIGAEGVWQILNSVVPEFGVEVAGTEKTCASPLAIMCPAKTIERDSKSFPPLAVLKAGESACEKSVDEVNLSCQGSEDGEIPESVPNGYFGYSNVIGRDESDPFSTLKKTLESVAAVSTEELEGKIADLQEMVKSLESEIKILEDKVGTRDDSNLVEKAELHSLRDTCHEVEAGKYVYEVCINGRAQQKDKGQKHGTSLGQWEGMTMEDGVRILSWKNGQKCWNGPHRSATVKVACGAETKVLNAEEPDTCRYVLQMESPIACDEQFYSTHIANGI